MRLPDLSIVIIVMDSKGDPTNRQLNKVRKEFGNPIIRMQIINNIEDFWITVGDSLSNIKGVAFLLSSPNEVCNEIQSELGTEYKYLLLGEGKLSMGRQIYSGKS